MLIVLTLFAASLSAGVLVPPVLVLTPENRTGKAEFNWIGLSFSIYLSEKLLPLLNVASIPPEARAAGFESIDIPESGAISHATMIRLASELKALYVLSGYYELTTDGNLQITIIPFDTANNSMGHATSVKSKLGEIISMENTIGYNIVKEYFADPDSLKAKILGRDAGVPLEAYEYFIKSFGYSDSQKRLYYLSKATTAFPGYAEAVFERAKILYAKRDFADVIKLLSSPPLDFADNFAFLQGMAYYSSGDLTQAAAIFTDLIAKPSLSCPAMNNLAAAFSEQNNQQQAAFYLLNAIQLDGSNPALRFNFGIVKQRAGAKDEAISAYKDAARLDPNDWQAQYILADLLAQAGLKEEAQAVHSLAISHAPQHLPDIKDMLRPRLLPIPHGGIPPDETLPSTASRDEVIRFHLERGFDYCRRSLWIEATEELKKVLYLDPYHGEARYMLAKAYFGVGDLDHAMIEAKMSLWSSETAAAHVLLAKILNRLGRQQESQHEAERALELDPSNADVRALLPMKESSSLIWHDDPSRPLCDEFMVA